MGRKNQQSSFAHCPTRFDFLCSAADPDIDDYLYIRHHQLMGESIKNQLMLGKNLV